MSRSEFFARAAERYLDDLDRRSLTGQIDAALDVVGGADESSRDAVAAGGRNLRGATDDW